MNLEHQKILNRLPYFELSYETITHKKVCSYDLCLAIPLGKKAFLWFTFREKYDVCFMLCLNRDKKIIEMKEVNAGFHPSLSTGTIIYGTFINENNKDWFITEDIFYYKGISLKNSNVLERFAFLDKMFQQINNNTTFSIMLVHLWKTTNIDLSKQKDINENEISTVIPDVEKVNYPIHHIQYRSTSNIDIPYLNVNINKKINIHKITPLYKEIKNTQINNNFIMDYFKPQYKRVTVFQVSADIQYDIYNLHAYSNKSIKPIYYDVAFVPNYKTSVFLNGLFRKIRENKNLDYIEESDDEEDFQTIQEDKYVDLNKVFLMECVFNFKFKKWIPIKLAEPKSKIINIECLVK